MLVDTHCHIHESDYPLDREEVLLRAREAGVEKLICVGTSIQSSKDAIEFARTHENVFASIGVHPHETKDGYSGLTELLQPGNKVVAVGEIGLDYFYNNSPREVQIKALEAQLQLALDHNLPVIFHVREAFDDFWPIFDSFKGLRGELHSFTDTSETLEQALSRGLLVGVNGISTFAKAPEQQAMFGAIPLDRMLLETDAPFLTPAPLRGTINEPAFVKYVAEFHAAARKTTLDEISSQTSANALALFAI